MHRSEVLATHEIGRADRTVHPNPFTDRNAFFASKTGPSEQKPSECRLERHLLPLCPVFTRMHSKQTSSATPSALLWEEDGESHSARWRSESGIAPPKRVVVGDDHRHAELGDAKQEFGEFLRQAHASM